MKKIFKPKKDCNEDFPPVSDQRWDAWCVPIEAALDKPKTYDELKGLFKPHKLGGDSLRNILAWLKFNNKIKCLPTKVDGKLTWIWKRNAIFGKDISR